MKVYHLLLPIVLLGIGFQVQLGQTGVHSLFSVVAVCIGIAGLQGKPLSIVAVFLSGDLNVVV